MPYILIFFFLFSCFLTSCSTVPRPTEVYQTVPVKIREEKKQENKIQITDATVVLDARPAFDFLMAHINGSYNMRGEEFMQRKEPFKGVLEKDLFFHTRRLARLGISPETPVVVVGRGVEGGGEEGQLAWILMYLGVKSVKFAAIRYFSIPMTSAESPPRASVPLWKPILNESLLLERDDFLKSLELSAVLDVRSEEEFLKQSVKGAINIPWLEFFDRDGFAKKEVVEKLTEKGFSLEKEIFVISNQGRRSAAVTLALQDLGFQKAKNFSGGFKQLFPR